MSAEESRSMAVSGQLGRPGHMENAAPDITFLTFNKRAKVTGSDHSSSSCCRLAGRRVFGERHHF
jgi:hypothetical protein